MPNALSNAVSPTPTIEATLPSWTDAQAITSYFTSIAGLVLGLLGALNPTWGTAPKWLAPAAALAGFVIATGAQIFNFVSHRSVNKAAIAASATIHAAAIAASTTGVPETAAQLVAVAQQSPLLPLQITSPAALPDARANQPYLQQLTAQGGTRPIRWNIAAGQNAGQLKLDAKTGVLTGAANVMVTGPDLDFTITATDSSVPPQSVQQVVKLRTA